MQLKCDSCFRVSDVEPVKGVTVLLLRCPHCGKFIYPHLLFDLERCRDNEGLVTSLGWKAVYQGDDERSGMMRVVVEERYTGRKFLKEYDTEGMAADGSDQLRTTAHERERKYKTKSGYLMPDGLGGVQPGEIYSNLKHCYGYNLDSIPAEVWNKTPFVKFRYAWY